MKERALNRLAIFIVLIGLVSCAQLGKKMDKSLTKPSVSKEFEDLSKKAYEYLNACQDSCKQKYGLGDYERWDYDQETGFLEFSDSGVIKLRIRYEEVGSISNTTETWLWAWANPNLLDKVKGEIGGVKDFGNTEGIEILTKRKWYGDEYDAWEMTAISALILNAKGAYKAPGTDVESYLIFMEIEDLRMNY